MVLENRFMLTYRLWHMKAHPQSCCYSSLIGWCQRMHPISVEEILLLHWLGMLVAWKDAFLKNYLATLAEQKHYLSVWLRASNERCFCFNWRLVIIKHEKLLAAKFCPEMNARFINCSQLLPPRPLITHWNWKLICSSVQFLCSFFHSCWGAIRTKKCFLLWIPSWEAFNFNCARVNVDNFYYYTFNSLTLFWLAKSVQWIFEISTCNVITADYTIVMSRSLVIMSTSRDLCCLPSVKKQKHDFQVFAFNV